MIYHAALLDTEGNKVGVVAIRTLDTENPGYQVSSPSLNVKKQNPVTSLNEMLKLAIENSDEGFDDISSKEYWRFWH